MDKIDMLFVRACKSRSPEARVNRVYKRFFWHKIDNKAIVLLLIEICENYAPMKMKTLIDSLNPHNKWMFGDDDDCYHTITKRILISHLRMTAKTQFEGYIEPIAFRKYMEKREKDRIS